MVTHQNFWQSKKVLVTGHTGFKGSWLSLWLQRKGADVTGLSLEPPTNPGLFVKASVAEQMNSIIGDIRDLALVKKVFLKTQPEIVIHMAAQPLVRYSYLEPVETYATNVMGTLHVLEGIRSISSVRSAVMITTDKCYENKEWLWGYRENELMGGYDPYSSSKGCAELLIASYRNSYFPNSHYPQHRTAIASARAGNVIGGGDWADDRLIPDMIKAFSSHKKANIRNPNAIRPWQHVLEPLSGYLQLAEKLYTEGCTFAEAWNFGPKPEDAKPVEWIVKKIAGQWGDNADWLVDEGEHPHEAHYLKLDCSKANERLHWFPQWSLAEALTKIVEWHKSDLANKNLKQVTLEQIKEYVTKQESDQEFKALD
jgi:CDP-glucose 4,6-dehydratase